MATYNHKKIEKRWQKFWEEKKFYRSHDKSNKSKYYQLETFPYPSAAGLHVGHPKGYIAEDTHARYMRMSGREVLYTMGWDAFGLPTENYAIKIGKAPQEVAKANIKNFKRQIKMFGLSYDWEREINTSSPEYYKWTQWLFIQLFNAGLAYRKRAIVNWCPKDQTVLANEQVVDGKCERDSELVVQKEMAQWFFRITDYTERLLDGLDGLDWPASTIKRQKDWIGKSEGASIKFKIQSSKFEVEVFTTRPDTIFGATYLVLAPELEIIDKLKNQIQNWDEVKKYINDTKKKTELDRMRGEKDPPSHEATDERGKTGVELKGIMAVNPANKEKISVWIADYVLSGYGTGAIMAVPAHDQRDFEFAKKFKLPVKMVICPNYPKPVCPVLDKAYEGKGYLVDSEKFSGMKSKEASKKIVEFVGGQLKTQYKIRDWSVSRQRYWGVPIPMIHCPNCDIVPVPEKDLPIKLPPLKDYRPKGKPPLAGSEKFTKVKCPKCGESARRDSETLDTFVDSSWYFLRYPDPKNNKKIFDATRVNYWMPVDLYVIGAEHTVLHLLYSRFITKFLHDRGYIDIEEPFLKLKHVGLILGEDNQKMSKSKGNVINPDEIVEKFGADSVRLYEMFMGPFEEGQPWDTRGILGVKRFLDRVWRSASTNYKSNTNIRIRKFEKDSLFVDRLLHKTIKKVTEDIENFHFNTAISALMIFLNEMEKVETHPPTPSLKVREGAKGESYFQILLKLLAPFAPHMTEEIWQNIMNKPRRPKGGSGSRPKASGKSIHLEPWPKYDPKLIENDTFELIVQINGKVRDKFNVPKTISQKEAETIVLSSEKIKTFLSGKTIHKVIFVPKRLINFVV